MSRLSIKKCSRRFCANLDKTSHNHVTFQYVWKLSNPRDKRELEVQLKNNLLNEESEGPIEEKDFDIAHYERVC